MNQDQLTGIIRAIVPALLAYVAGKGWIPGDSIPLITTAVIAIAAAIWSVFVHTQANTVAKVAAMPEVKKVEMEPTTAGHELAIKVGSTPSAVVTVAGPPPTSPKDK